MDVEENSKDIIIHITEAPLLPATDWIEDLEDRMSRLLSEYGCKGNIFDTLTGNITQIKDVDDGK